MSAAVATEYVRKMVDREGGDAAHAMTMLEAKYGIGFWTLDHFRRRKAKTCDVSLYARIHAAFIDHCGKQAARLIHEAETAKAVNPDVHLADIEDQIRALAAQLEAAKAHQKRTVI